MKTCEKCKSDRIVIQHIDPDSSWNKLEYVNTGTTYDYEQLFDELQICLNCGDIVHDMKFPMEVDEREEIVDKVVKGKVTYEELVENEVDWKCELGGDLYDDMLEKAYMDYKKRIVYVFETMEEDGCGFAMVGDKRTYEKTGQFEVDKYVDPDFDNYHLCQMRPALYVLRERKDVKSVDDLRSALIEEGCVEVN